MTLAYVWVREVAAVIDRDESDAQRRDKLQTARFFMKLVLPEAGMYAIRARRKTVSEKDFLEAVTKVIKQYAKFSATPKYMAYSS